MTSFAASPTTLSNTGGTVTLSAQVTTGLTCTFSSNPVLAGLPATVPCTDGLVSKTVSVPANPATKAGKYKFSLSVLGSKTAKAPSITVPEDATPATPTVKSISPATGSSGGGTTVTLTGKNLIGAIGVRFGSAQGTQVTLLSPTEVTAVSPAGSGTVDVTVTTPGGTSVATSKDAFTYLGAPPGPTVTGISPGSGPTSGGTAVTITGTNLSGATAVKFGTTAGTVTADSASSITVTSPTGTAGTVDITVTTPNGTSPTSSADEFAYTDAFTPCSGPITTDSVITAGVYQVNCELDVPSGITLTVDPGAVLKFDPGANISVEGTFNAVGTASNPVTLTSINDNTVGGTTGTGSPAAGDWGGIDVDGGSIDLEQARISYSGWGLTTSTQGSVTVKANSFSNQSQGTSIEAPTPTVENNSATEVGGGSEGNPSYIVTASDLNPALLGGNSASGGLPLFSVNGTVGVSGTLPAETAPWYLTGNIGQLDVPVGVTLTLAAGAVVKGVNWGDCPGICGSPDDYGQISVEGTFNAVGTASNPVTLTSINDNTVGGTTGTGSPAAGDWGGIDVDGGSIDLEQARISYSGWGLTTSTQGSVTVKANSFSNQSQGTSIEAPTPTVENNSATEVGGGSEGNPSYIVTASDLNPALLGGNSASGGLPLFSVNGTVGVSGTLPAETAPWYLTGNIGQLDVPVGVTLTLAAGAVVKGVNWGDCPGNCGSPDDYGQISVEGTFNAVGTASNPVTLTSINDNTVGGTTGTGSPAAGDWGGIDVDGGSIDLEQARISYSGWGLTTSTQGSVTVKANSFSNQSQGTSIEAPTPTVENNSATEVGGGSEGNPSYIVTASDLNPALLGGNSASGGLPLFSVNGTVGVSGTLPAETAPWYLTGNIGQLDVPVGVTLTLAAGAVVKGVNWGDCPGNCGSPDDYGQISVEGTFNAVGTASNPVTLTSINDNTVGGTTGTGSPAAGDWGGIDVDGGSIDLEQARISYSGWGLTTSTQGSVTVKANSFSNQSQGTSIEAPTPTVENNSATEVGGGSEGNPSYIVTASDLNPALLGGNSASGGLPLFSVNGTVGVSGTLPAETAPWYLTGNIGQLDVPVGVTLTLAAGAVVKGVNWGDCPGNCGSPDDYGQISVEGTFNAVGTASNPVTLTSINDNTVGGTTGTGSPAAGDWGGIDVDGGSIDLEQARISYSGWGLTTSTQGSVTVKANSFSNQSQGTSIEAPTPTVENNSATEVGGGSEGNPSYIVTASDLNPALLGGNSASGGLPLFSVNGTVGVSGTLPAETAPWYLTGNIGQLDVPVGVTLTLAAGAVVKGVNWGDCPGNCGSPDDYGQISVEGTFNAVGTASNPVTLTSINDNTVGGTTGTGSPAAGDWGGIVGNPTAAIDLEYTDVGYGGSGIDVSGGSGSLIKVDSDRFSYNTTAISVSAAVDTNARFTNNVFVGNSVAINASSNWTTATAAIFTCGYVPTMTATGNSFDETLNQTDEGMVSHALVSPTDYAAITTGDAVSNFDLPVQEYPDEWTDGLSPSDTDTISWSVQPCLNITDPTDSYVAITTPLNLTGDTIIPLG